MSQPRQRTPSVELTNDGTGTLRYSEHGMPSELIRWHIHDDYELHLITRTRGKFFVGDFIGTFRPGQLVLTGPRLPHNWVSDSDQHAVRVRDQLIHFDGQLLVRGSELFPELSEFAPLWERAKFGVEFIDRDFRQSRKAFRKVRDSQGLERTLAFLELLRELNEWPHYRLLSTAQIDTSINETTRRKINTVIEYIFRHYAEPMTLSEVAGLVGMADSYFSSFFRKSTGNRFVEFLNRVRVSRACTLLLETDRQITRICYDVGFNNVANFNRRFHELKGVTPSEFRAQASHLHS